MKQILSGLMTLLLIVPLVACGQSQGNPGNVAQAANSGQSKEQQHAKNQGQKERKQEKANKKKTEKPNGDKIVITSDILEKIDKQFNTDLPFKHRSKYVVKNSDTPSWGEEYKNGVVIDDHGIVTSRVVSEDGSYKHELLPFQERPWVRAQIGNIVPIGLKTNDRLERKNMIASIEGKIRGINEALKYAGKYSPALEKYLKKTKQLLKQDKKNHDFQSYKKHKKRLKKLYFVLCVSDMVQFK